MKPKTETLRHAQAFEEYYWMGQDRSTAAVARRCSVSKSAMDGWCKAFSWDQRVTERDEKFKREMANRNDQQGLRLRQKLINVGEAVVARFAPRLMKDPVTRIEHGVTQYEPTAADARQWAQMILLMTGQATSRTELSIGQGFVDALLATVSAVLRREVPRCCPTCKTDWQLPEKIGKALMEASTQLTAEQQGQHAGTVPPPIVGGTTDDPDAAGELH